jgi:hypothetical protein
MALVQFAKPVKLFIGMLSNEVELLNLIEEELQLSYGVIDLKSPMWQWNFTRYYDKEMGHGLLRRFVFFNELIMPENLLEIKLKTIELENRYLNARLGRRINLDPGYLNLAKIVLASTKDFSHRVYFGKGIYGEVTLYYQKGVYKPLPYTFPDYQSEAYLTLFEQARQLFKQPCKDARRCVCTK